MDIINILSKEFKNHKFILDGNQILMDEKYILRGDAKGWNEDLNSLFGDKNWIKSVMLNCYKREIDFVMNILPMKKLFKKCQERLRK